MLSVYCSKVIYSFETYFTKPLQPFVVMNKFFIRKIIRYSFSKYFIKKLL